MTAHKSATPQTHRHLLDISSLTNEDILTILRVAARLKRQTAERINLSAYPCLLLFEEPSTRTHLSFWRACHQLNIPTTSLNTQWSSLAKGETWHDTIQTLEALGFRFLVVRSPQKYFPHQLAQFTRTLHIINAGDGDHAHPTQALLDAFTLLEIWHTLKDKTIGILGDIRHARVAHSDIHLFLRLGARVLVAGPTEWLPNNLPPSVIRVSSIEKLVAQADALIVLRVQKERFTQSETLDLTTYRQHWMLRTAHIEALPPDRQPWLMHPGPMNPGIEIEPELPYRYPRSLILRQVENGIYVRMGVFLWMTAPTLWQEHGWLLRTLLP